MIVWAHFRSFVWVHLGIALLEQTDIADSPLAWEHFDNFVWELVGSFAWAPVGNLVWAVGNIVVWAPLNILVW